MRKAQINRKTNEVNIKGGFIIDGHSMVSVKTGFKFLDHLLTLFAFHGNFDLTLEANGDLSHHIIEDIGIALGDAFKEALGDAHGIKRYGSASVPMDNSLSNVTIDISGRPFLSFVNIPGAVDGFSFDDAKEFLDAFVQHGKFTLHIEYKNTGNEDTHHTLEAIFKALGIALDQATQVDPRRKGVPSTKGVID